jgi:serine/threonine protein kinase/tetratricopeptide (TPR) repeat protein
MTEPDEERSNDPTASAGDTALPPATPSPRPNAPSDVPTADADAIGPASPAPASPRAKDEPPSHHARRGDRVGPYVLIDLIGEGSYGEVWKAEQKEPVRRTVAIKILNLAVSSKSVVARFAAEQQVLAMMDHPGIARVFDAGTTSLGRPYFVMDYIKGDTLLKYCDREKLTLTQRLRLFAEICDAVHHAHQKQIVHRDLKPQNIVVKKNDKGGAQPVVVDFGVAKALTQPLTDATVYSVLGGPQGTWAYMSPEQAEGLADIDTQSDIYSLGVVLYELLSGLRPFDDETLNKAGDEGRRRLIREKEPPSPGMRLETDTTGTGTRSAESRGTHVRELAKTLRGELGWIPLKAMRKERGQRYTSAAEFAEDVRNYLEGKPLKAGPLTTAYRTAKFVRRNRLLVGATVAVMASLAVGLGIAYWQWSLASSRADQLATQAERLLAAEHHDRERREAMCLLVAQYLSVAVRRRPDAMELSGGIEFSLLDATRDVVTPRNSEMKNVSPREALDSVVATLRSLPPSDAATRVRALRLLASSYLQYGVIAEASSLMTDSLTLAESDLGTDALLADEIRYDLATLSYYHEPLRSHGPLLEAADRLMAGAGPRRGSAKAAASTTASTLLQRQDSRWVQYADWLDAAVRDSADPDDEYYRCTLALLRAVAIRPADSEPRVEAMLAALKCFSENFGELHPDTLEARAYVRTMLLTHRPEISLRLAKESADIESRLLPELHPARASTQMNIGQLLASNLGRVEEAIPYFERAIEIWEGLGQHCGDVLLAKNQLGLCLIGLRRREDSYAFHRKAIESAEKCEGAEEALASFYSALASSCGPDRAAECEEALRKALEMTIRLSGPNSDDARKRKQLLDEFLETGTFGREYRDVPLGTEPRPAAAEDK